MKKISLLFAILAIGFSFTFANKTLHLTVKGMHCSSCETKFKSTASKVEGVQEVSAVSLANSDATLVYDEKATTEAKIIQTLVDKTGYTISVKNAANATVGKPSSCCSKGKSNTSCKKDTKSSCNKSKED
ncbi:MAG: heavy metal-associated domain-containing protein [Chitinophagales bacterium]